MHYPATWTIVSISLWQVDKSDDMPTILLCHVFKYIFRSSAINLDLEITWVGKSLTKRRNKKQTFAWDFLVHNSWLWLENSGCLLVDCLSWPLNNQCDTMIVSNKKILITGNRNFPVTVWTRSFLVHHLFINIINTYINKYQRNESFTLYKSCKFWSDSLTRVACF